MKSNTLFARIILLSGLVTSLALTSLPAITQAQLVQPQIGRQQDEAFRSAAGYSPAGQTSVSLIVANVIKVFLGLLGLIFVVLVIYGGFLWLTSAGNEEKITKAKQLLTAAIIGLVIILAAYAITFYVIDAILEATTGGIGLDEPLFGR